jgi:hypothetical protein
VTKYLFSISDTIETVTHMPTAPPKVAPVCVNSTAVTNAQDVKLISAELSLSTLSTIFPSDISPEEITSTRLLKNISPVPKIPRKSIEKIAIVFFYH